MVLRIFGYTMRKVKFKLTITRASAPLKMKEGGNLTAYNLVETGRYDGIWPHVTTVGRPLLTRSS